MTAVCLIDASVFVEVLNVPVKARHHLAIMAELAQRVQAGDLLFLPMATILETGNHIGQNGDGRERRACAERFVDMVSKALDGQSPLLPVNFLESHELRAWLSEFPDYAGRGIGLGDLSIVHDWQRMCHQNRRRRVYIWSLDKHLASYDHAPEL